MRFKSKPTPKSGETRISTFFTWFALQIGDEIRWLETVTVEERFSISKLTEFYGGDWTPIRFID